MRKLYIEFTRPSRDYRAFPIFSWAIRAFEGTKYSHVRLTWINSTGRKVVYEASGSSVKFVGTIAQEKKKADVVDSFEIDIGREEYRKLIDICMEYADVEYGILQIFGIALTYTPFFKKNPFQDGSKSQVCSELVGRILQDVKGVHIDDADLDIAGPKIIHQLVKRLTEERDDFRRGNIAL